jgi:hypothetical protein
MTFQWVYKGLTVKEPAAHPLNPRTKLAPGDIIRIGIFCIAFGLFACGGSFFLAWYEGSWGAEYYLDTYGSGLMSDFWAMINIARYGGLGSMLCGAVLVFVGRKVDPVRQAA